MKIVETTISPSVNPQSTSNLKGSVGEPPAAAPLSEIPMHTTFIIGGVACCISLGPHSTQQKTPKSNKKAHFSMISSLFLHVLPPQ